MRSTITDMEREAVGEARSTLWESVVKTAGEENAQHLFANVDADGADFIIYSVWNALRASMQRQSAVDGIPVALSEQPSWAGPQIVTDLDDEIPF